MTLFQLLSEGCVVIFPSSYLLAGNVTDGTIDTSFELSGTYVGDGPRPLTTEGTRLALRDARNYQIYLDKK